MSYAAIQVENISKQYRIGTVEKRHETLAGALTSWIKAPMDNFRNLRKKRRFDNEDADDILWALRDVSFEVNAGEVVGIIGRNGAGKSTLLKIISRITYPTYGRAVIRGIVSSLLEVGTGFHPDLTGRENVYLNGTILGMSKREIDAKMEQIVAFAEIAKFIDTPVKFYSSGMKVRLAFSVAAHLEPDVLIIDEVLAVGDAAFQRKCLGKMGEVARHGRTVLFVSHMMASVRSLCDRVILLDHGQILLDGECGDIIDRYMKMSIGESNALWRNQDSGPFETDCRILEVRVHDEDARIKDVYPSTEDIYISIRYELAREMRGMQLKLRLISDQGTIVLTTSDSAENPEQRSAGEHVSTCCLPREILNQGLYTVVLIANVPPYKQILSPREYVKFSVERTVSKGPSAHEKLQGVLNPYLVRWSALPKALKV